MSCSQDEDLIRDIIAKAILSDKLLIVHEAITNGLSLGLPPADKLPGLAVHRPFTVLSSLTQNTWTGFVAHRRHARMLASPQESSARISALCAGQPCDELLR